MSDGGAEQKMDRGPHLPKQGSCSGLYGDEEAELKDEAVSMFQTSPTVIHL